MSESCWTIDFENKPYTVRSIPTRPFLTTKTFRNDEGVLFAINAKGELFCSIIKGNDHYRRLDGKSLCVLEGIARLGALPRAGVSALQQRLKKQREAELKAWDAERLENHAKDCGIALTPAQKRKVAALKRAAA